MAPEVLGLIMFMTVLAILLTGFPVALTLAGVALLFAFLGDWMGIFPLGMLGAYPLRIFGTMTNDVLVAVPLFIFMGVMLERSNVAGALLETMGLLFGRLRGGLGISVIVVGMLLAASTGIVGATVVTMGLLSLPIMLRMGYDPKLATGLVCASGTLGQIIPPSIVLVLLAEILQGANESAAALGGDLAPEPVTVIDLFAGALLPGLMLVGLYICWQIFMAIWKPSSSPIVPPQPDQPPLFWLVITGIVPPMFLIVAVLGSILFGIATPTESAAVGAIGAALLAVKNKRLTWSMVRDVGQETTKISSMVFLILIGASMFSLVFRGFGGDELIEEFLSDLPGGLFGAMFVVMAAIFFLGFFLDFIEIIFVVVPIVGPILIALGIDPLVLGIMIGINLQTSFLTPPFGFALFYLRGAAPPEIKTTDIYRGVLPFVVIQLSAIGIIAVFPGIATWLPRAIF
jgi:tripartite ATP-independent transporter DctM subunit